MLKSEHISRWTSSAGMRYCWALLSVGAALFATRLISSNWNFIFPTALFFPAIILATWIGGWGPGLLSVLAASLSISYFILPPFNLLTMNLEEVPRVILFVISALVIVWLVAGQKRSRELLRQVRDKLELSVQQRTSELRQSEEKFRLMVERVQDYAIFMLDIAGNIKSWNIGAERITGYKATEIIGQHFSVLYLPEEIESGEPMTRLRVALAESECKAEGWRLCKTGLKFYANIITTAIRDEAGVLIGYSNVIRDLTEKKKADEKLKGLQTELAHMSRVMMMGELTASIAHEINQPIGAIANYGSACRRLLAAGPEKLSEVDLALSCIIQDANRVGAIISRIRGVLKKSEPAMETLCINSVVEDILLLIKNELAARGVTFRIEIPKDLPRIVGDRVQIQQVLMNLILNGMDAMSSEKESPGIIVIRGESHKENQDKLWVQISVEDSGIGLTGANINQLFEAFYTTKQGGLGMGLAICRSIVESHRGRLWAKHNSGPGLTFYFVLPSEEAKVS
ncbi:MAG: ATP-binding protein [Nitrospiria bacterium]